MDTIKNLAVLGLICLAGYWFWQQNQPSNTPKPQPPISQPSEVETVDAEPPAPAVLDAVTPSAPPPLDFETPKRWFTTRRLTLTTDSGIAGLPAGSEVQRVEDGGFLFAQHQGRRFPAKYDDLTTDEALATQLRAAPAPSAPTSLQLVTAVSPPAPQAQTPSKAQIDAEAAARRQEVRNQTIQAIDARIRGLQERIAHEQLMARRASNAGRSSSRGVTIQRLQAEIDALEQQKMAAIRSN